MTATVYPNISRFAVVEALSSPIEIVPPPVAGIYLISGSNSEGVCYYIGQSKDILARFRDHKNAASSFIDRENWTDVRMVLLAAEESHSERLSSERRFQAAALNLGLRLANHRLPAPEHLQSEVTILRQAVVLFENPLPQLLPLAIDRKPLATDRKTFKVSPPPTSAPAIAVSVRNTVSVFSRHSGVCIHRTKGGDWLKCGCSKALLIYEADRKKNRMVSAHTRSWAAAEKIAQELRDSWDPEKQELKQLRAKASAA